MTFQYAVRRAHPWYAFWHLRRWEVYRVSMPRYVVGRFSREYAIDYSNTLNELGGFNEVPQRIP